MVFKGNKSAITKNDAREKGGGIFFECKPVENHCRFLLIVSDSFLVTQNTAKVGGGIAMPDVLAEFSVLGFDDPHYYKKFIIENIA